MHKNTCHIGKTHFQYEFLYYFIVQYMEQPDIEKEVKRLFRADAEAISVKWELITDDDKGSAEKGDAAGTAGGSGAFSRTDTAASLDIGMV